jgi:hypothetical protein
MPFSKSSLLAGNAASKAWSSSASWPALGSPALFEATSTASAEGEAEGHCSGARDAGGAPHPSNTKTSATYRSGDWKFMLHLLRLLVDDDLNALSARGASADGDRGFAVFEHRDSRVQRTLFQRLRLFERRSEGQWCRLHQGQLR